MIEGDQNAAADKGGQNCQTVLLIFSPLKSGVSVSEIPKVSSWHSQDHRL
jgi:hypothetical protein